MQTLDPNTPWGSPGEMSEAYSVRDSRGGRRMDSDAYYRECWEAKSMLGFLTGSSNSGHYDQTQIPGGRRDHVSVTFRDGSADGTLDRSGYAQVTVTQADVVKSHRDRQQRIDDEQLAALRRDAAQGNPLAIGELARVEAERAQRPNPNGRITPYRNREEMLADMGRPEYRSHIDPSWREHVEARIAATS